MAKALTPYFAAIPTIKYEGPASDNALAYKWFNANEKILGKPMKEDRKSVV